MSSILAGGATKQKTAFAFRKGGFLLPAVYAFCDDSGDIFDIFFAPAFYPFGSNGKNSVKVKRHYILPFAFFKKGFEQQLFIKMSVSRKNLFLFSGQFADES